jgi:hypothetical protein
MRGYREIRAHDVRVFRSGGSMSPVAGWLGYAGDEDMLGGKEETPWGVM